MRILILGGTVFLGRFLTEAALAQGDEVTLFNRGKSNPDLFPQIEHLVGDRNGDLAALKGRKWDVVVDTCGFTPKQVRATTELLADSVEHSTFISSISVYSDYTQHPTTEDAPLNQLDQESDEVTGETYGAQKAHSEQAAEHLMPGRVLNVRAGLIVGPYDYTWRFPYWVQRVAQGGEVLAPGDPHRRVQFIDGRDLAEWILRMAAARTSGTFNATGPDYPLTMRGLLYGCKEATESDATFTWVDDEFLVAEEVGAWEQMPLWIPASENMDGIMDADITKALAAGLTFRPVTQTALDTYRWIKEGVEAVDRPSMGGKAGLAPEKEQDVLQKWKLNKGVSQV